VTLSGVVVIKAYAGIAADYASEVAQGNKQYFWPEFSLYDCAACHHELRREEGLTSRPRQSSPPGRPPMPRWTAALLGLACEGKPPAELEMFQRAFTQRPFGDPKQIAETARKLQPRLEELSQSVGSANFDNDKATKSLTMLLSDATTADARDYASARQVAWAIEALRRDLAGIPYGFGAELSAEQQQNHDRITALFRREGRDELLLTLPARQENSVVGELPKFLQAMGEYDPEWFAERLKQMK
jgi:hypothetical protein